MDEKTVADSKKSLKEMINELTRIAHGLDPWYDVGKISWYAVYAYEKSDESEPTYSNNLFDIFDDEIEYYDDNHIIPKEAMRVILSIQDQMKKINDHIYLDPPLDIKPLAVDDTDPNLRAKFADIDEWSKRD